MSSPVNIFIEALKSLTSRVLVERQRDYLLVLFNVDSKEITLCFRKGQYTSVYYAKLALTSDLLSLDCTELEYSPHGLYVFSENPVNLAESVIKKAKILAMRSS